MPRIKEQADIGSLERTGKVAVFGIEGNLFEAALPYELSLVSALIPAKIVAMNEGVLIAPTRGDLPCGRGSCYSEVSRSSIVGQCAPKRSIALAG